MKMLLLVVLLTMTTVTVHCRVLQGTRGPLITGEPLQGFDLQKEDEDQGYTGTLNDDDEYGYTGKLNDDEDDQGYTGTLNDDDYQGYSGTLRFERSNLHAVNEGDLYEGDILLSEEEWAALRSRKAIPDMELRWPEGPDGYPLVPYHFMDSSVNRVMVRDALNHWMENTCIKFEETSNMNPPHVMFITGHRCMTNMIGMKRSGQFIMLSPNCKIGNAIHEVGHAIGWYHEHSRSDRDKYVITHSNHSNYNKEEDNNYGVPYDYTSIMHYPRWALVEALDPRAKYLIGQRDKGLSHRDKLLANRMYDCTGKWLSKCKLSSDPCLNDGYMRYDDRTGQCACVCPPGTRGSNCEESFADYYGFSKCNPSCYNGECKNGKCHCKTGFTGKSCSDKETDCIDKNKHCKWWADNGECKKNPDYMLSKCPKACNQC